MRVPAPAALASALSVLPAAWALSGCVAEPPSDDPDPAGSRGEAVHALIGGTVVDGTGGPAVPDGHVLYEGDTITCVGTAADCPVPEGAEVAELDGRFVTPGLIDAHVHFGQTGWLDGRPDGIDLRDRYPYDSLIADLRSNPERWFDSYVCAGVTGVFDVGGFRWTIELADRAEAMADAPHMAAAGPLISHAGREVLNLEADGTFIMLTDEEAGRQGVRELAELGADAVKVWYLVPPADEWDEIEARFRAVAAEADSADLPLIVHATQLRAAKVAVDAGAAMLVHSVQDEPVDDEFVRLLETHGTIYAPTLTVGRNWRLAVRAATLGEEIEIDDELGCVDAWTRGKLAETGQLQELIPAGPNQTAEAFEAREARTAETEARMADNLRRLHEAGVPVVLATDAGNPLTLHGASVHAELEAMEAAGVPPADLLVMATRNGARAMGRTDIGTLERGKVADILILRENPLQSARAFRTLETVILKGEVQQD